MTGPDREALLETLFHRALGVAQDERAALLAQACPDDPALVDEVSALLRAHGDAPSCLDHASWCAQALPEPGVAAIGERLGPYELVGLLGEGGMGSVYRAQQLEPFERQVAIKLIKPGMDTREVLARFESERRLLARLSHANIASVFDAGMTPMGRPYFVMELVDGAPITRSLDRRRASLDERLRLFVTVCGAVQHAHQKGVLHRDLKPGNVLVTDSDGAPVPKVIDFGVAKALVGAGSRPTLRTRQGQLIGTPGYMSPEQAAVAGAQVDTRSDVYSLGVLLYELSAGVLPVDVSGLAGAGDTAVRRRLDEAAPVPPSERLATLSLLGRRRRAGRRGHDEAGHRRALRGSLDAIIMKAIAPDPAARYASASELAADVAAHLAGGPVSAGPPALPYRLARLAARHRRTAAAALVCALLAVSGPSMLAWEQGGRLADLEQILSDSEGPEAPPPRAEGPADAMTPPATACGDCELARLDGLPADTVLVRNVGRRSLAPGEVLALRGETEADGALVFEVSAARADGSEALLGVALRAVERGADGHLHGLEGGLLPGALGQAVARGSLVSVRVDGPVPAQTPLGTASLSGSAAAWEQGPVLGTVQRGWDGPGPGLVRATVAPSWPLPAAPDDGIVGAGGLRPASAAAPAGVGEAVAAAESGRDAIVIDDSWGVNTDDPEIPALLGTVARRDAPGKPGPVLQLLPSAQPTLGSADGDVMDLRAGARDGGGLGSDDLGQEDDLGELAMDELAMPAPRFLWLDHDLDGLDDLLLLSAGELRLLRNQGQGQFVDVSERLMLPADWAVADVIDADFDLDGRVDLVLRGGAGDVLLLRGEGAHLLVDASAGSGLDQLSHVTHVVRADPDADGLVDLLVVADDDSLQLLVNLGGAAFLAVDLTDGDPDAIDADLKSDGGALELPGQPLGPPASKG